MARKLVLQDWLTYTQAARELNLSISSVRVYASRGVLERAYVGGEFPLVSRESVEAYKEDRIPAGNPNFQSQSQEEEVTK
jgi:hypothetical protein